MDAQRAGKIRQRNGLVYLLNLAWVEVVVALNALTNQAKVRTIGGMLGDIFDYFLEKRRLIHRLFWVK